MEIDKVRRGLVSVAGAAALMPIEAYAQSRTRANGANAVIDVDAFGAKGDGASDDTQAIRAAIAAANARGGGVVSFGRKDYLVTDEIQVDPTRVSLSGSRTVLRLPPKHASGVLLRIAATAGSPNYGHGTQYIEGIEFSGPGQQPGTRAILFNTPVPGKSSRIAIRNCVIHGFEIGVEHRDRCYLVQHYSVQIFGTRIGMAFTSNVDAGENTSLFGCSIFNSDIAVSNPAGTNIFAYGCSFDYCRQWFVGQGNVQFFGCWFEKSPPLQPTDYPFELSGSSFLISGGGILTGGADFERGNACAYYFMLKSRRDHVTLDHVNAWNLRTASGALAGGQGTIEIRGITNVGRAFVPAVTKDDAYHNVFGSAGSFDSGEIAIPCWLEAEGGERLNRHSIVWSADGRRYAEAKVELSGELAKSGQRSLRVRKGIGPGTPLTFNVVAGVQPGDAFGLRFWWRASASQSQDAEFWMQVFFVQIGGADSDDPRVLQKTFIGEAARRYSMGATQWMAESFNSYDLQEDSPSFCRAPAWATHALLTFNLVSASEGTSLFIDDLAGFRM